MLEINPWPILTCREVLELPGSVVAGELQELQTNAPVLQAMTEASKGSHMSFYYFWLIV